MKVLQVRNVHEGLPRALEYLEQLGENRDSRNGPVLQSPCPVTTVYERPNEKVLFWPDRDANPAFHLFESIWMLAGRNDLAGPQRYVKTFGQYSDDGVTLHGAYGHRWRFAFNHDQLPIIVERLKKMPEDRRSVLQMWDSGWDLRGTNESKDVCCNLTATLQRGDQGELNLVVFCRSNDVIFGCYGANAVHFGFLLEYLALAIGCPIGSYSQVSVNFHAYQNDVWEQVKSIRSDRFNFVENPYTDRRVHVVPMTGTIEEVDRSIRDLLFCADHDFKLVTPVSDTPWNDMVYRVLKAHNIYRTGTGEERYLRALDLLATGDRTADWIIATEEWLQRRLVAFRAKNADKL